MSGRQLHQFLQIGTRYNDWFTRMAAYGFERGRDFYSILSESTGGRHGEDHVMQIDMAKEICMIQRTPLGKQAREYFIEVEKQFRGSKQIDLSTPQGVLDMARQLTATAEQLVAAHEQLEEQRPLVQQALTYQAGGNLTSRQDFAREVISWGHAAGYVIKQTDVFVFLARKLGLFVRGERADAGNATVDAIRRGLAETEKGTAQNGHNYATGKLTARGKSYAFDRIVRYVEQTGTLQLPEEATR